MATKAVLEAACYWDASAVLSVLLQDQHGAEAQQVAATEGLHLVSSLCYAEVGAAIERVRRERQLSGLLVDAAWDSLRAGPWRQLHIRPEWHDLKELSRRRPLRGADLWHLATAKALERELGSISLLSFDSRLAAAASGEGLSSPI